MALINVHNNDATIIVADENPHYRGVRGSACCFSDTNMELDD